MSFFDPTPHDKRVLQKRSDRADMIAMSFMDVRTWHMWRGGQITEVDDTQVVIDFMTKQPRYFCGSDVAIPLLLVTVQTEERNPGATYDTGLRRIFIPKTDLYITPIVRKLTTRYGALVAAMEREGLPNELPAIGGALWIRCDGLADDTNRYTEKLWSVHYDTP